MPSINTNKLSLILVSTKGQFKGDILLSWDYDKFNRVEAAYDKALDTIDKFLVTTGHTGLMAELNEMQHWVKDERFKEKYTIPLYFINLILRQYNLELKELTDNRGYCGHE